MEKTVRALTPLMADKVVYTPVTMGGGLEWLNLKRCGCSFLSAEYGDGSTALFVSTPSGFVKPDEMSVVVPTMPCPSCGETVAPVPTKDTVLQSDGDYICTACGGNISTEEVNFYDYPQDFY